jgi:hypothetical protein
MRRGSQQLLILALIWGTMFPIGCVRRHVEGDTTTVAIEPWVIAVTGLASFAAGVVGSYVRRKRRWPGYILIGGGILVLCTTVPGLSLSRAIIDADHVEWSRGFNRFHFRFDDLAGIEHTVEKIPIGRSMQDVHYLDFTRKSGERTHIQVEPGSDRFFQDASPRSSGERGSEVCHTGRRGQHSAEATPGPGVDEGRESGAIGLTIRTDTL